jgi:hypothetical protein
MAHTAPGTSFNAGHITDTLMRRGNFSNVPGGYSGAALGAGLLNTTVSGAASAGRCNVPPLQLVVLDDPADTISAGLRLCNNSNAPVAGGAGYQGPFASGQFYTQPAVSYANIMVSTGTLYAVPFFSSASGGRITKLGIDVTGTLTATCRLGVYGASNGQPSTLLADGGTLSGMGTLGTSGTLSPTVQLAPQTLYFLAVGCSGSATLEGATNGGGALPEPLVGLPNYTSNATRMTSAWTFTSPGGLPATFSNGGPITNAASSIPNVYARPGP